MQIPSKIKKQGVFPVPLYQTTIIPKPEMKMIDQHKCKKKILYKILAYQNWQIKCNTS